MWDTALNFFFPVLQITSPDHLAVHSMKVYILCVYVQPVLDDIINGISAAVFVFLLRYIRKSEILSTRVVFQCDDFFPVLRIASYLKVDLTLLESNIRFSTL